MGVNPIEQELQNFQSKLDDELAKPKEEQNETQIAFYESTIENLKGQLGQKKQLDSKVSAMTAGEAVEEGALKQYKEGALKQYNHVVVFGYDLDGIAGISGSLLNDLVKYMLDAQALDLHNRYNGQLEEQAGKINELAGKLETALKESYDLTQEKGTLKLERDDFEKRFTNAGEEYKTLHQEFTDLQTENADLRKQLTEASAPKFDPNASHADVDVFKERIAELKAARPKIYDVQPVDFKNSAYRAKLVSNDQEIVIPHLELNRYNVIPDDQVDQFRSQSVPEAVSNGGQAADAGSAAQEGDVKPPPFQNNKAAADGLDQHSSVSAHDGQTPETFEEEVRRRLSTLEDAVFPLHVKDLTH